MTPAPERVLVFHTAFIGDIVLMFPLLQTLRQRRPGGTISVVTVPAVADLVRKQTAVDEVISYDKRGVHRGWRGIREIVRHLRMRQFTLALVPHRSIRSALIVRMARIPRRIGFSSSAGARLFTDRVSYRSSDHEIDRDLSLLQPVLGDTPPRTLPVIAIHEEDARAAALLLERADRALPGFNRKPLIALAPGSVWLTKRWPMDAYAELGRALIREGLSIVLIGGERDVELCESIAEKCGNSAGLFNAAGMTSLAASAALLQRCRVLVSNDSAPGHIAMGVGTPVLALFGPTVPAIGFAPVGPKDRVVEVLDLPCRPCNIHGGNECPIGSFACMRGITVAHVMTAIHDIMSGQ